MISLAALLILTLSSCASPFGYSLRVAGGWDASTQGDRIYFEAERIEGQGSGLAALVIPAGWREQAIRETGPGFAALEDPLELTWRAGEENNPEAIRHKSGLAMPVSWRGDPRLQILELHPSDQPGRVFDSPSIYEYGSIHETLLRGGDAYVLSPQQGDLKHGFDLYGAVGPPVLWVHLGYVEVESGEGWLAYGLARSLGAVAWGLDLTYMVGVVGALGIGLGPLGGAIIFTEPLSSFIPETPW